MRFQDIKQFPQAHYEVNISWDYLERWIADHDNDLHKMVLDPDYQRAHVWSKKQQTAYVEFILRGGESGRLIYWNHPNWMGSWKGALELVDGKQRLEAVRLFLRDKVKVFGGHVYSDYTDRLSLQHADFRVRIARLPTRAQVLEWYLMINAGGTPHKKSELERVQALLAAERSALPCCDGPLREVGIHNGACKAGD
jgi:hypothetical protein